MSDCSVDPLPLSGLAGLGERAAAAHVPLQALVELTGRCHMDCQHCYLDIKHPPKGELSTDEWIGVFDELAAAGTMFLTLTGGEIFLRKDIFALIEAAKERRFAVRLFTSGTLLDRKAIARIAELAPTAVEISIYGLDSKTHDAITRRRGSLRKSLKAALLLRRAGVPVAIKSPMLRGTESAHFQLIDAAKRMDVGFNIDPSLVTRHDGGTEPLQLRPGLDELVELFSDTRLNTGTGALPAPSSDAQAPCAIARRVIKVGATGDVFPCSSFPIAAGNVRSETLTHIWTSSPLLNELRGITTKDLHGECGDCSRKGYCGRCSAQALMEHGNYRGPSAEACLRAEAKEKALGVAAPAGAKRVLSAPLGRRDIAQDFVPLTRLVAR